MDGDRAANIKRARELRALGITYEEVSRRLALEGIYFGARHLSTLCRDVPCPQLRGRPRLYSREEAARRKRELARLNKIKHRERTNRREREARANETPIEREYRLEQYRIYREQRKQRLARAQDLDYNGEQNGGEHE